jgi:NADPH-dependent 2,4-dienoyl-CoA reductase/sulfur reductase-like enzyme
MDRDQPAGQTVTIHWEGRPVVARTGQDIASALFAAGIPVLGRSRKFHRPQGLGGIFLAGVKAEIDGMPNRRLDQTPVRAGQTIRMQNTWPNGRFDLMRLAGLIPRRWLRAGFEHPAFLPGGSRRFQLWESFLRVMAGGARPAAPSLAGAILPGERLAVDVAIVGGSPAGRKAAIEAAARGQSVLLISRSTRPGATAAALGATLSDLPAGVTLLAGWEAAGLYRKGKLLLCAPLDGGPAKLIEPKRLVLATGRRSMPPLVSGADLPGVLDLSTAVSLLQQGIDLGRTILIGTCDLQALGKHLSGMGATINATYATAALRRISGRHRVERAEFETGSLECNAIIHAGPWRSDPALPFQASADGVFRLGAAALPAHIAIVGSAAERDEPITHGPALDDYAFVCPCMDVTVGEIRDLVDAGITHVEELKRLTGCGMGPCQGFPCWDLMAAALAEITAEPAASFGHPSYRPPRGTLSIAQAAGLADLVTPEAAP